ncbi:phage virion morphogenesis protein [Acinetobacter bouvetii]|uniref:Phage virion morphogenesis family protein n=1 Tax=Acinetobacter bouvetii TaxID=202951 RepID=A0A811GMK2_9GAMM|nr:phage virion morphogenesis protein [Acinetobacter bouvetii]CAB1222441.1 Phage virion morphogenesis family protein [Acinetobacter bouvetii]
MSIIQINNDELVRKFTKVALGLSRPKDLTSAIAGSFLTIVEDNFDAQGRPAWAGLSPVTEARRKPGKILSQSGQLRDSIQPDSNDTEASISTSDPKAATHQFGAKQGQYGKSSRGGPLPWGDIAARSFMPMDENGNLQLEAENAIYDDVDYFYQKLFD